MRRIIFYFVSFILFPIFTVLFAGLFFENVSIGKNPIRGEQYYMGKTITVEMEGLCKNMDVEEYLVGVLAGVISADYNQEAIKAQAVAVRTNILKEMEEKKAENAKELSYRYLTVEERKELFGNSEYEKKQRKIQQAVMETAGQVLVWDDVLIMAVYHEVSMGKTISAKEAIGEDIPYLQSVDSSQDVESKNYLNQKEFTWEELNQSLGQANTKQLGVEIVEKTEHGLVKKVIVGDIEYSGEEFAKRIGLDSVIYEKELLPDGIRFVGLGKGNGMGMSLYGANVMAQQGENVQQILEYYYSGAVMKKYNPDENVPLSIGDE